MKHTPLRYLARIQNSNVDKETLTASIHQVRGTKLGVRAVHRPKRANRSPMGELCGRMRWACWRTLTAQCGGCLLTESFRAFLSTADSPEAWEVC